MLEAWPMQSVFTGELMYIIVSSATHAGRKQQPATHGDAVSTETPQGCGDGDATQRTNSESGGDDAAWRVDVQTQRLRRRRGLQKQQLRGDEARSLVVDGAVQAHDALLQGVQSSGKVKERARVSPSCARVQAHPQQPGEDVERALAAARLLDDDGHQRKGARRGAAQRAGQSGTARRHASALAEHACQLPRAARNAGFARSSVDSWHSHTHAPRARLLQRAADG